jgi:hypothetical protein
MTPGVVKYRKSVNIIGSCNFTSVINIRLNGQFSNVISVVLKLPLLILSLIIYKI